MRGDEFADDRAPRLDNFRFVQSLVQSELLHQLREKVGRGLPSIRTRHLVGKSRAIRR